MSTVMLGAMSRVIVKTNYFDIFPFAMREPTRMMLKAEIDARSQREGAILARQSPDNSPICAIYLVRGASVAC